MKDNEEINQVPVEGILGTLVSAMHGGISPRWFCMNVEAKAKYVKIGRDFIEEYKAKEAHAKKSIEVLAGK